MAIVQTEAIVLQTFKLADADKIAVCMTEKAGLVRGVARGARRLKSKFGASLEPFTLIHLTYFEKEARELVTLKDSEILKSYFGAARDAEVVRTLGYLSELVKEFAPPQQADASLFKMLRACIDATAKRPDLQKGIAVYAELWALKLTGLLADARVCGACGSGLESEGAYISTEGAVRCRACSGGGWQSLCEHAHDLLKSLRKSGPERWAEVYSAAHAQGSRDLSEVAERLVRRALERETRANRVFMNPPAVRSS